MSMTVVYTIAGLLATCVFGLLAIKLAVKYRHRTELTFYEENCISLFESIVQSIEGIEVSYEKKPVGQNLVLLTGCIVNTGNRDIDKSTIHKPLAIHLVSSFKWLKANIVSSSPQVNAEYDLSDPTDLVFRWDLLKPGEHLRFDALVETPSVQQNDKGRVAPARSLRKNLSFSHRITNLGSLQKGRLPDISDLMFVRIMAIMFLVGTLFLWTGYHFSLFTNKALQYKVELIDGRKVDVRVVPRESGKILLTEIGGSFEQEIEAAELLSTFKAVPVVVTERDRSSVFWALLSGCGGVFFIVLYLQGLQSRKRLRALGLLK